MFGFVVIEVMTLSGHPLIINKIEGVYHWKDLIRNIAVIFQTPILKIVGF